METCLDTLEIQYLYKYFINIHLHVIYLTSIVRSESSSSIYKYYKTLHSNILKIKLQNFTSSHEKHKEYPFK